MSLEAASVGRYREKIIQALKEPMSANEVAQVVGCNQHTAQSELMELAVERKVRHKKVGRTHLFWKVE